MTWASRFRLIAGLIAVVLIVAVSTLVFNQRITQVTAHSASIVAESYPLGSDYSGFIEQRFVSQGDLVEQGDPLFTISSLQLQRDLAAGIIEPKGMVSEDGLITVSAPVDGTVTEMSVSRGGFAQAGAVLATVSRSGSLTVTAEFALSPRDFERIEVGADVDLRLPNQARLEGTLESIQVTTENGTAVALVRVASEGLVEGAEHGLVSPGTPVVATVHLRDDGPLAGVQDMLYNLGLQIGL